MKSHIILKRLRKQDHIKFTVSLDYYTVNIGSARTTQQVSKTKESSREPQKIEGF